MNVRATPSEYPKWNVYVEGAQGFEQSSYSIHENGIRFCVYRYTYMVGDYPSLQSAVDEIKALMGFA